MRATLLERFLSKIEVSESGCWEWQAQLIRGYGCCWDGARQTKAHRFSYEFFNNTIIPQELEIDHLCRNLRCVNPDHLEAVTHRTNLLRGDTLAARESRVICCPIGHPYDLKNTSIRNGKRYCRICARENQRSRRAIVKKE